LKAEREEEAEKTLKVLLKNMTTALEFVGKVNPQKKIYNLTKDLDYFPLVACVLTLNALA